MLFPRSGTSAARLLLLAGPLVALAAACTGGGGTAGPGSSPASSESDAGDASIDVTTSDTGAGGASGEAGGGGEVGDAGAGPGGWVPRSYVPPTMTSPGSFSHGGTPDSIVTVSATKVVADVFPTQFGVNSNFRSGGGILSRLPVYRQGGFGAFRFPAGNGANAYFWDGKIPTSLSTVVDSKGNTIAVGGINGENGAYFTPEQYSQFLGSLGAKGTVVVNYFYARYGMTAAGTRAARVQQAADYAAGFVKHMNVDLHAGIVNWEIGNECYGNWEPGYNVNGSIVTGKEYGEDFVVFAKAMKAVDPTIKVGAILKPGMEDWNGGVLSAAKDAADFVVIHHYFGNANATPDSVFSQVGGIEADVAAIGNDVSQYTGYPATHYPIELTEFNSQGYASATMTNGLFVSELLGEIVRNGISLSTLWVNEWSCGANAGTQGCLSMLAVDDPGQPAYTPRPTYMPFYFYGIYFGDRMLQASASPVAGVDASATGPGIRAYASSFSSGQIGLVIVNTTGQDRLVRLTLGSSHYTKAYWHTFSADNLDAGNERFYVNGLTSTTAAGGPASYLTIPPYEAAFADNDALAVGKYSVTYMALSP